MYAQFKLRSLKFCRSQKFANDWKSRLKKKKDDPSEVLAFLQFLFYKKVLTFLRFSCRISFFIVFLFQSALTGESLLVTKNLGDGVCSVSTCKQGAIEGLVIATGVHTLFGKAIHLVETITIIGHFQQIISVYYIG